MRLLLLSVFTLLFVVPAFSQEEIRFNADSLFLVARQKSMDGNYQEAIELTQKILEAYPGYTDARILMARSYAWQKDYPAARETVQPVLGSDPKNYEANSALVDFYLWDDNLKSALNQVNEALSFFPDDVPLLTKKARIQTADSDFKAARQTLGTLEALDPELEDLEQLKKAAGADYQHIIRLEHYFDTFDDPYKRRWHMSSLGYGRRTTFGDFYAKVYWGDMVESGESLFSDQVSTQYALEFYPKIDERNYMFLNYAWSGDDYFPQNRFGIEYWHVFKYEIEASLGYRFMNFPQLGADDLNIHIYTGSLAKYLGKFWFSFRPYFIYDGTDTSSRYMLSARNYLKKDESYLELVLGTGISPDNPYFYTSGQAIPDLSSWRVELEWKQKISNFLLFEIEGGYENAEYQHNQRRDQFSIRTALSFLF